MDNIGHSEKIDNKNEPISPACVHKLCRSCLCEVHRDYFSLEGYYLEKRIFDIYKNVTAIEVDQNDFLPKKLCSTCYNRIIKFDLFKNKVLESEKILAEIALSLCTELSDDKEEVKTEIIDCIWENERQYQDINEDSDSRDEVPIAERLQRQSESVEKSDSENEIWQKINESAKTTGSESSGDCTTQPLQIELVAKRKKHVKKRKSREQTLLENKQKRERKKESCKECGKILFAYKMQNHLRTHTKEKPFECEVCGARFSEKSNLNRHSKIHGNDRPYRCYHCGKGFLRPSSRAIHEMTAHRSEKNILCTMCGKSFKHQYFLNKHMANIHNKNHLNVAIQVSGYQCPICGNFYRTKSSLTVHKMKHEQPKAFLCNICGKAYSTKAVLENHQRVHTGEKNFSCDTCSKKFRFMSTLKTHILVHSGEKPLSCHICNKQFRQHSHLNTHIKGQHSTNRPYQCSFCSKTFKQSCNLRVHTRIHTGETPYHCDVCQKGFYDSSSMKKHKRSHFDKNAVADGWDKNDALQS